MPIEMMDKRTTMASTFVIMRKRDNKDIAASDGVQLPRRWRKQQ
jgi:hypothetical protein